MNKEKIIGIQIGEYFLFGKYSGFYEDIREMLHLYKIDENVLDKELLEDINDSLDVYAPKGTYLPEKLLSNKFYGVELELPTDLAKKSLVTFKEIPKNTIIKKLNITRN